MSTTTRIQTDDATLLGPSDRRPDQLAAGADDDATRVVAMPDALRRPISNEPLAADAPMAHPRPDSLLPGEHRTPSFAARTDATAPLRQVGRYLIGERIGRGGMAAVFRAEDPGIGRHVAIKFLHASLCEDAEYRSRFLSEARAAGGLSHPAIVTVHDVGEIDGRPYMAMELIEGEPLAEAMAQGNPLPVRDAVLMGIQLAQALDYAHARGTVHRDIKPGNIMRVRGTQTVKVLDFGIAHIASGAGEQRTRVGDVLGTPQYMSPEQARGEKLDGRSDLFSSGIVLYQMLTGQRPFSGDSLVALAVKIANDEPPPIEKLRPDVPASLRRVVGRCLAKPVDRRFQTGRELADALTRVLAELDAAEAARTTRRIVPLRVKWAALMALVVAVVMGLTASIVTHQQNAALGRQLMGTGASLARFIAAQNAAAALGEEWPAVDATLQELMKTRDFDSIDVMDRAGVVRASSRAERVGQPYRAPPGEALAPIDAGGSPTVPARSVAITRHAGDTADGRSVLGFTVPIQYRDKTVGTVALGLPEAALTRVARLSVALMAVLVVVTVLAVAIAMAVIANRYTQPVHLVADSMGEIAKGRWDHRIGEQRNDEFGLLYAAFDRMAEALLARQAPVAAGPVPHAGAASDGLVPRARTAFDGQAPQAGSASGGAGLSDATRIAPAAGRSAAGQTPREPGAVPGVS